MLRSMIIRPYIGLEDIRFGMTPDEVESLIGPATISNTGFLGEKTEYRQNNGFLATYSGSNTLVELGFSSNIANLELEGIRFFLDLPQITLDRLIKKYGFPYETVGFIIFPSIGITLAGFHDEVQGQKAVTAFSKGRWDDEIGNMNLYGT